MLSILLNKIPALKSNWENYSKLFREKKVEAKTILLNAGEISRSMFFVRKGCLRIWLNDDGKDVTIQFFFENEVVSSIESFINGKPSLFTIESIEPSVVDIISRENMKKLLNEVEGLNDYMQDFLQKRMMHYSQLFLRGIKDSPEKRYKELLDNNPLILQRIPLHYIASYLGITPVSLSRIRKRLSS